MPWPEKDLCTRLLAATVGAFLGASIGFGLGFMLAWIGLVPESSLLFWVLAGVVAGSIAGAWRGDPAIRFLLRLIGS